MSQTPLFCRERKYTPKILIPRVNNRILSSLPVPPAGPRRAVVWPVPSEGPVRQVGGHRVRPCSRLDAGGDTVSGGALFGCDFCPNQGVLRPPGFSVFSAEVKSNRRAPTHRGRALGVGERRCLLLAPELRFPGSGSCWAASSGHSPARVRRPACPCSGQ